jgi:RsiW-degrading membrane proteinase PrsW (M82 family)
MDERDPVKTMAADSRDLYDIATWERRTPIDHAATAMYWLLQATFRVTIVLVAFLLLLGVGGLSTLTDPRIGMLTLLSVIPAFGLAAYVYYSDTTSAEPITALIATFLLGILTANFAAASNSLLESFFEPLGVIGMVAFFFVVVGPVEETVKLLAVRLYAYNTSSFNCVIDGAVYGAMAGLGFATVENSLFIARQVGDIGMTTGFFELIGTGGGITAVRGLAGPGHVIYSAVAGYYLGLAKFNRDNRGPIIIKGLFIAAVIHATYNSTVGFGSSLIAGVLNVPPLIGFFGYVVVYDTIWGLYLLRKVRRYSATFRQLQQPGDGGPKEADTEPRVKVR